MLEFAQMLAKPLAKWPFLQSKIFLETQIPLLFWIFTTLCKGALNEAFTRVTVIIPPRFEVFFAGFVDFSQQFDAAADVHGQGRSHGTTTTMDQGRRCLLRGSTNRRSTVLLQA